MGFLLDLHDRLNTPSTFGYTPHEKSDFLGLTRNEVFGYAAYGWRMMDLSPTQPLLMCNRVEGSTMRVFSFLGKHLSNLLPGYACSIL